MYGVWPWAQPRRAQTSKQGHAIGLEPATGRRRRCGRAVAAQAAGGFARLAKLALGRPQPTCTSGEMSAQRNHSKNGGAAPLPPPPPPPPPPRPCAARIRSMRVPQLLTRAPVAVFQHVKAPRRWGWNARNTSTRPSGRAPPGAKACAGASAGAAIAAPEPAWPAPKAPAPAPRRAASAAASAASAGGGGARWPRSHTRSGRLGSKRRMVSGPLTSTGSGLRVFGDGSVCAWVGGTFLATRVPDCSDLSLVDGALSAAVILVPKMHENPARARLMLRSPSRMTWRPDSTSCRSRSSSAWRCGPRQGDRRRPGN
jgi:hypothetical protein